jgi:hypothetical protein
MSDIYRPVITRLKKNGCNDEWTFLLLIRSRSRVLRNLMIRRPMINIINPIINLVPLINNQS